MIQIISGEKGKGKTKVLLNKVNTAIKTSNGNIVYLDKNPKHMFDVSTKVRLVNVKDYLITNCDEFLGFLSGIISQDNDLEELYLDSFLTISNVQNSELCNTFQKLGEMSEKHNVNMVLSVSMNEVDLPECAKELIIVSL
ncbi:MAG: twitching motility protein PilT [Lachnospiraceae bacterium]